MPKVPASANKRTVILLTGLSGAGKSTALKVFEDLGFLCVDGLPPHLTEKFAALFLPETAGNYRGLTLGMDIRQSDSPDSLSSLHSIFTTLSATDSNCFLIFIEAGEAVLTRRYAATRRPHPLEGEYGLRYGLTRERQILAPLREKAHLLIDTSAYSIHDLRKVLQEKWDFMQARDTGLKVYLLSFGFKHGMPGDADMVFDLRFLPNPYFDETLRLQSGKEQAVADFVLNSPEGRDFLAAQKAYLEYILPCYAHEGRYRLTIALGCTGGRHRSVAATEALFDSLKSWGYTVYMEHRHIDKV